MKEFADLQKRPDKAPEQPIQKPLQINDIWPKTKKKVAGYGAGGYGKTALGFRKFSVYELATGVRPETLIAQAAASSGSEELTGQRETRPAQGEKSSLQDDPMTNADTGHDPLQPTPPVFPIVEPPVRVAQVIAPARTQPQLQNPLIRSPIFPKSGAPSGQPKTGQPLNRSPVGTPTTGDPMTDFTEGVKARKATVGSVQQSFGNRLPKAALGMPSGFLETVNGQWNSITQHKTLTGTGAQVADPNYPPTAQQTLQVWNAAWASWAKDPTQLPPEERKAYARDYQNYLQVQKTLKEQAAAEAWAGQALTSLKPPKTSKASKSKSKTSKANATPPTVHQPTTAEIQQKLDKLKAQNDALTAKINAQQQLKDDANVKIKANLEAQKKQIERREQELTAQLRQIESQGQTKKAEIQTELINSKIKANRQLGASILSVYLDAIPPERRQQVTNQAAELYRQQVGRPYNFKDPNDPNNEPSILSGYVLQVRGQSGVANVPVVTKPEGLPKPTQKQGDKTLPTLPIQPKKPDGQQGSFLPQPLPKVKPKSDGEPAKEAPSQAQPVTSKASAPSEVEPTTAKQDEPKGQQKRTKPTASSVKKAMTATQKWGTDYRANYKKANGSIPAGHQIHHIAPRAVFNDSGLAQEWVKRGLTKLDYPENLQALPQTQDAYDKSSIKIQHSGSHGKWSRHAEGVLREEQTRLIKRYGSLDKVPDDVMKQTKDSVMQQLREDLQDKDLGLEKGWVIPKDSGMDKLSQSQSFDQIG